MANRGLGSLTLDLIAKIGGFVGPLSQAERDLDKRTRAMERRAQAFGKSIGKAIGVAIGAVSVGAVIAHFDSVIDRMDEMRDASIRLGVGVETLSAFGYAAQQTGTDIDALGRGLKILAKNAADALNPKSSQFQLFEALGIGVTDAEGKLKSLDQLIPEIADKFKALEDGTTKAALAQELFGKSGLDLIEFLNQGSDGLGEMTDRARELGLVIDQEAADKADKFNDTLAELKGAVTGLSMGVASELLPKLTELAEWARDWIKDGTNAKGVAEDIAGAFDILGSAANIVYKTLKTLTATVRGVTSDLIALYNAFRAAQALRSFQFGDAKEFFDNAKLARQMASEQSAAIEDIWTATEKSAKKAAENTANALPQFLIPGLSKGQPFSAVPTVTSNLTGGIDRDALNRALSGTKPEKPGKAKTAKAGKSDEEKEAERLKAAYDRMNESLGQQIALFGKDGEEARVRYEIEHGELQKLSAAQKDALIVQAQKIDQMRDEAEVQKQLDEANKRRTEAVQQVLDDIQTERDLLGQTAEYQDTYNKLKYAGVDANSAFGQSIIAANHELHEQAKATADQVGAMDTLREAGSDFLADWASGAKSTKDAWLDMLDAIEQRLLRWAANGVMDWLLGEQGTSGGGQLGGALGGILSSLSGRQSAPRYTDNAGFGANDGSFNTGQSVGGGGWSQWLSALASIFGGGRAGGGPVQAGRLYEVAENGPEMLNVGNRSFLMMGAQGGHVTPSAAGAGGGTYAPTFNFLMPRRVDNRAQMQVAQAADREGREASRRNGGRR